MARDMSVSHTLKIELAEPVQMASRSIISFGGTFDNIVS